MKQTAVFPAAVFPLLILLLQIGPAEAAAQGTVVTSSETVRASLTGETPVSRSIATRYSSWLGQYFLDNLAAPAPLRLYDATYYSDPVSAATWYSACVEPACYTVNQSTNTWTTGTVAYQASDFRNAQKVLDLFASLYGRNGADGQGENLNVLSGLNSSSATAIGIYRSIALGRPDYVQGRPSYGTIGMVGHEFAHLISYHEWIGLADYSIEGSLRGVAGSVDEHLADLFGVIASYLAADEPWVANARWAYESELEYGANYPHRNEADFYRTMIIPRNAYLGLDLAVPRAHVSQLYIGPEGGGGASKNAVLLDRAAYLFTEGGYAGRAPDGVGLSGWPVTAPDIEVRAIGVDRLAKLAYHLLVTPSFTTAVGRIGLSDLTQVEQDTAAVKAEMTRFAYIMLAACESLAVTESWPSWVSTSVRNGFAAVGLLEAAGVGVQADDGLLPVETRLEQNYPNPFNPSTTIRFGLSDRTHIQLMLLTPLGQELALLVDGEREAGTHEVTLDGSHFPAGVYFCRLRAQGSVQTRKLLLIK